MKRSLLLMMLVVLVFTIVFTPVMTTIAQNERLSVAYVVGHDEGGYLLNDISGFSRFSVIINDAGATVRSIEIDGPIPDDIDLIILSGPKRPPMSWDEISRVWSYLGRGGSLLILNDPRPNAGLHAALPLNALLWQDYGIRWREDAILENWFSENIARAVTRRGYFFQPRRLVGISADPIPGHPISQLLTDYSLAAYYWLGRSLEVQAPALRGDPVALLAARTSPFGDTPFGETSLELGHPAFNDDGVPELNIGDDTLGRLILGAAVEDRETGARIVVFGDSDLFKNGYGLEYSAGTDWPLFSGNNLIAQSTMRWLLKQPLDDIDLTSGYLWIAVDGNDDDWSDINPAWSDPGAAIEEIKVARSDRALYFMIAPQDNRSPVQSIYIDVFDSRENLYRIAIEGNLNVARIQSDIGPNQTFLVERAVGDVVEVRFSAGALPVGDFYTIAQVCIAAETTNCAGTAIPRPERQGREPRGRPLVPNVPTARLELEGGAELLIEQGEGLIADLEEGTILNVFEFSESGAWARVQTEGMEGWVLRNALQYTFNTLPED